MIKNFPKLGLWKKVLMDPKIIAAIFITLLLFDFALSYNKKNVKYEKEKNTFRNESTDNIIIKQIPNEKKHDYEEQERLLDFTRKIDISEINNLIDNSNIRLNKNELDNIKSEIKKVEEKGFDKALNLSRREKNFLEYTIRLDLNEIKKQIDTKIK